MLEFSRDEDGSYVIDTLDLDGTRHVGPFARMADAWEAIDQLDAPSVTYDEEIVIESPALAA